MPLLNKQQWRTFFSEQQQWSLIKTPTWQQQCLQTSVLTRCSKQQISYLLPQTHPQGILARQLSRLLELVSIPEKLSFMLNEMDSGRFSFKNNKLASGEGLAVVEAARGTLVHWFKMKHNVITDYRILAPTEWNFHPRGVAIKGLESITTASLFKENPDQKNMEILQQQSKLWLSAIDPCVRYQLEIIS